MNPFNTGSDAGRSDFFPLLGIFIFALAVRLLYLVSYQQTEVYPVKMYSDSYYFYRTAQDIAAGDLWGGGRVFMRWPLYGYWLALLLRISAGDLRLVIAAQMILGALTCVLVYIIGKKMYGRPEGIIAGTLCAALPMMVFYDGLLLYTTFAVFLTVALFLMLLRLDGRRRTLPAAFLGFYSGLCTLAQANSGIFAGLAAVYMLGRSCPGALRFMRRLVCYAFFFMIPLGAAWLHNYYIGKDNVLLAAHTGVNFFIGNNKNADGLFFIPPYLGANVESMFRDAGAIARIQEKRALRPSEVSRFWFGKGMEFFRRHPFRAVSLYAQKIRFCFAFEEPCHDIEYPEVASRSPLFNALGFVSTAVLFFGILGLCMPQASAPGVVLLRLFAAVITLTLAFFFVTSRYRLALMPLLAVSAGNAIVSSVRLAAQRRVSGNPELFRRLFFAAVIYAVLAVPLPSDTAARAVNRAAVLAQEEIEAFIKAANEKDFEAAMSHAGRAQQIAPESYAGFIAEADGDYQAGRRAQAAQKLTLVAARFPHCVYAYYFLGMVYNKMGLHAEAVSSLTAAMALDEDYGQVYLELGRALRNMGNTDEARRILLEGIRKTGKASPAHASIQGELERLSSGA